MTRTEYDDLPEPYRFTASWVGDIPEAAMTHMRCLDCHGSDITLTDDGGFCGTCDKHVFIYTTGAAQP